MTAEIITIGDEILIGQIVDTNSAFIAQNLNKIGVSVHQITSIEDDKPHILTTLEEASGRADIILITGGLGPTNDDVTKYTLSEFFDDVLVKDDKVLEHIEELFKKHISTPISDLNREQALVPSKATVIYNEYGTAPGLWMKKDNKVFIAMPGVPFEMKMMMENHIIPKLKEEYNRPFIFHKTIRTYGLGESAIALRIKGWEDNLPKHIKLAYLPGLGKVRLRLSGKGENEEDLRLSVEQEFEKVFPLLEDIISDKTGEDHDIAETLSKMLIDRKKFLSAAESCTGGKLAADFTTHPGSSSCFKGGVVTYATHSKSDVLNVPKELIEKHSVVSAEVAEAMAKNVRKMFRADYGLSTTGNAGPDKGDSDAEVGTVYLGLATPDKVFSKKFVLGNTREQVVEKTITKAFEMLLKELSGK